jgi:NTE family protein
VLDGTRRLIDKSQGVPIERAIAASTALPALRAPITIGDRRYMDGGVGGSHLDAAGGYRAIVALLPGGSVSDVEIDALGAQGSEIMVLRPDAESAAARGPNAQDPGRMRVSAEAGLRWAAAVATDLREFLNAAAGH